MYQVFRSKIAKLLIMAILSFPQFLKAQWPVNAASNLAICTASNEQTVPKIAATSDGGCFIAWYDHRRTNYDVYIQYLNNAGIPQLGVNGLLVSSHTQETWITDWDMTVDQGDNAILAINDIRSGGDWDIYGYSISTTGTFNWGADGKALSDNTWFEPTPRVITASDGNIYFTWQQESDAGYVVNVRKVSPDGVDLWNPVMITLTSNFGLSIPRLAPTNDGGFLLQYLVAQSGGFPTPNHLYIQRYNADGMAQWQAAGVGLNTAGGFGFAPLPNLVSDGNDGAISYWYDSRTMQNHVYVQRIDSSGTVLWTSNGILASTATELQTSPALAFIPSTGNTFVFYQTSNTGQTASGVGAQMFNAEGVRQWSDDGIALVALSNQQQYLLQAAPQPDGSAVVVYLEYLAGSAINSNLKAIKVNTAGTTVWGQIATVMASTASQKGHLAATHREDGMVVAAWHDDRNGTPDIYVQNINPDGSFGAPVTPLPAIIITSPDSGSVFHRLPIAFEVEVSDFAIAPENSGDGLMEVQVFDAANESLILSSFLDSLALFNLTTDDLSHGGDYKFKVRLADYDSSALMPEVADSIDFTYIPPTISITAPEDSAASCNGFLPYAVNVTDFEVGPDTGHIKVSFAGQPVDTLVSTDGDSILVEFADGWQTLVLSLQNADGSDFLPYTADSIHVFIFICDEIAQETGLPQRFELYPTYPNPFNPSTTIQYRLPHTSRIELTVFDMRGRQVAVLQSGIETAGLHQINWQSDHLASGVYLLRLSAKSGNVATQKIVKLK